MEKLTKTEEGIMHIIWRLERCTVSDILKELGKPKPPHSTISSIVRILEKKDFVNYKAYGRTHEYFPLVTKDDYSKKTLKDLVTDYFGGSMNRLVSFMVDEKEMDIKALEKLINEKESNNKKQKN